MNQFTLSSSTRGPQPENFGPFAYPAPASVAGYRLTPEGLNHVRTFLATWNPVCKLAFHNPLTAQLARMMRDEQGLDELESTCRLAVIEAVRRWKPDRAELATAVGWEIYGQLTRVYRPHAAMAPVCTNARGEDKDGSEYSDLDFVPAPGDRLAARIAAADLAVLMRRARLTPGERKCVLAFYGWGMTLIESGSTLGVSKERARQLARAALLKLRWAAGVEDGLPMGKSALMGGPKRPRKKHANQHLGPSRRTCPACKAPPGTWCVRGGVKQRKYCPDRRSRSM